MSLRARASVRWHCSPMPNASLPKPHIHHATSHRMILPLKRILGRKRVDKIDTRDVMAVLLPIWNEKRQTARRVRQYIGAVMRWSVAQGHREDNPAGDAIGAALPKSNGPAKHYRTIPHGEVADAITKVRYSGAGITTKLAIEFLILTAARSGEVRLAAWDEIILRTVPA